jgi:hypothetical protein
VFALFVSGLVLCGLVCRSAPFFGGEQRLLQQFPSEDGYLMLTIARNIGTGLGMSTAAGTIPTNGTQPFLAFVWALGFWVVDGDRESGVAFALAIQFVVAALAAGAIFLLGSRLLGNAPAARGTALLAASTWYATMLSVMHGMNCLETGTYAFVVVLFVLSFLGRDGDPMRRWSTTRAASLGAILGFIFWVRVDSVFLVAAACFCRAVLCEGSRWRITRRNVEASLLMGGTALLIASPWLLYSRVGFGSFIPISGIAQSWRTSFADGARQLVANLAEYILVVVPIPRDLETNVLATIGSVLVIAAMIAAVVPLWIRAAPSVRAFLALVFSYGAALCTYYGLFFGAPYFMSRYLFPLSPFFALLWAIIAMAAWQRVPIEHERRAAVVGAVVLLVLIAYPNLRLYRNGLRHMHFQVVEWVEANVTEDVWVGAIQSGALGFFHDRTINLDGKVNPEALEAARAGKIPEYVLAKPIRYIADWHGVASWSENEVLRPHFALLVDDPVRNLAVLARTDDGRS